MPGIAGMLIKNFSDAGRGIIYLFKSQSNARIELAIAILVLGAGWFLKINSFEWLIVILCIALVLSLEGINTSIEILADKLHPGKDNEIRKVKDVAAGAVLVAAIVSAIAGFIIFVPYILDVF